MPHPLTPPTAIQSTALPTLTSPSGPVVDLPLSVPTPVPGPCTFPEGPVNTSTTSKVPPVSLESFPLLSTTGNRQTEGAAVERGEERREPLTISGAPPAGLDEVSLASATGQTQKKGNNGSSKDHRGRKKSSATSAMPPVRPATGKRQLPAAANGATDGGTGKRRKKTAPDIGDKPVPRRQAGRPLVDITAFNNNRAMTHKRIIKPSEKLRDVQHQ